MRFIKSIREREPKLKKHKNKRKGYRPNQSKATTTRNFGSEKRKERTFLFKIWEDQEKEDATFPIPLFVGKTKGFV